MDDAPAQLRAQRVELRRHPRYARQRLLRLEDEPAVLAKLQQARGELLILPTALVLRLLLLVEARDLGHQVRVLLVALALARRDLLLLGLVLASKRQDERGSLWGCIGLHGGLVSGWFLLQNGLLEFGPTTPSWLIGPGGSQANPLGGIVAIGTLTIMLLIKPFLEQNQENPDR